MSISMIGIDHTKASIDVRTIFSFTKKSIAETLTKWKEVRGLSGCVIISTCNRMEIYASHEEEDFDLFSLLCEEKQVEKENYEAYVVRRKEAEAVFHLFSLASGLQSRIIGEDQIITQVKDALSMAREQFATDNVCEVLFRMAVTGAKKVKTDVILSKANSSAIHRAVEVLKERGYIFSGKKCMVIGNGEMGKLSANLLKKEGCDVTVTVRQYRSGVVQIPLGCARIDYGRRYELLPFCDYIVSATSSPNYTLTKEAVQQCDIQHPITMIDLAVPRDIEINIQDLDDISLFDIDSFDADRTSEQTRQNIKIAEDILRLQLDEFMDWYHGRDVIARISEIKEQSMKDFHLRTEKQMKSILDNNCSEEEKEELIRLQAYIDQAQGKVINKMIFGLKSKVSDEVFRECVKAIGEVFQS